MDCEFEENNKNINRIIPRKYKSQNIINRLIKREIWGAFKPGTNYYVQREFYQNIYPNLTVIDIEKPPCFLRKFSPDGKYLIAFSYDQTSLEIYQYMGCAAAVDLFKSFEGEVMSSASLGLPNFVRKHIFNKIFKLKHVVNMGCNFKQLNRECSLFTNDGRYVIVGASISIPENLQPNFYELYPTNEPVTPTSRCPLEDYTLYIVDLHNGRLSDVKNFRADKIYLSHNQGIYLYNHTLAVLSIHYQKIQIFEIYEGTFIELRTIGRFCSDEEQHLFNSVYNINDQRPFAEPIISGLKHRFLVYLFKKAKYQSDHYNDKLELRKFFQYFEEYKELRMWKMQLLDDNHLLIKYASEEVVTFKMQEPNNQPSFFVIYNIWQSKVLSVYDNTSEQMLYLFENFCDMFRNVRINCDLPQFTCSPSNNMYANLIQKRYKRTIVSARGGGVIEATKRLLAQLPISAQSYSCSPYLDLNLFSYDDKWVSVLERPKVCGEYPIKFFARDSGMLKFRIFAGIQLFTAPQSVRRLVAFTFHPTDPFAISVQRINTEYVVNFHIRNSNTKIMK